MGQQYRRERTKRGGNDRGMTSLLDEIEHHEREGTEG
jgi:hypothetical protein